MQIVQLYEVVRTAHLERVRDLPNVTVLYRSKRYDFDASAAQRVDLRRAGVLGGALYALRSSADVVEINEPLVVEAAWRSIVFITFAKLGASLKQQPPPIVVSYAIANMSSSEFRGALPEKARMKYAVQRPLAGLVWCLLDRIAFGTEEAQELYRREFGTRRGLETSLIESVPAPAISPCGGDREPNLVFLGDLSARKGFPDVLHAWPTVRAAVPAARLLIVGRGAGAQDAVTLAGKDPRVTVYLEPSREEIFPILQTAKVLTLPSRRMPLWKEQIGLPILEGLANGCLVVTSSETGIARWLTEHGHEVVAEPEVETRLAEALISALNSEKSADDVIADLADEDGRRTAHDWMYRA